MVSRSWNGGPAAGRAFPLCERVSHPFTRLGGFSERCLQVGADFPFACTRLCGAKGGLLGAVFLWVSPGCVGCRGLLSPQLLLLVGHLPPAPQALHCPQGLDDGPFNVMAGPEPHGWARTPGALGPPALPLAAARQALPNSETRWSRGRR